MKSRVVFDVSSQDWNHSDTEGNETSLKNNVGATLK